MSKVQTAVLHIDTLWLDYRNSGGNPDREHFSSYEEACSKLFKAGYIATGENFTLHQKIYMRAVAENSDAIE